MKLAKGMLLAALAAWAVASPSPARATGKIRSVDVYDPDGVHSFPNPQAPLAAGDAFRVKFRLVNLGWAQTVLAVVLLWLFGKAIASVARKK